MGMASLLIVLGFISTFAWVVYKKHGFNLSAIRGKYVGDSRGDILIGSFRMGRPTGYTSRKYSDSRVVVFKFENKRIRQAEVNMHPWTFKEHRASRLDKAMKELVLNEIDNFWPKEKGYETDFALKDFQGREWGLITISKHLKDDDQSIRQEEADIHQRMASLKEAPKI